MNDYTKFNQDLIREIINKMMKLEKDYKDLQVDPHDFNFYSRISELSSLVGKYQGYTMYLHSVLQRMEEFEKTMG